MSASPSSASRFAEIRQFVAEARRGVEPGSITAITGGISPRKFFRVELGGAETAIVMDVPPETPDLVFAKKLGRAWPFLELRSLLESVGVRVPRLLAAACERGLLLVEDLGRTLAEHLVERPDDRASLYRRAVEELARAQIALDPLPPNSIVRERAFDAELLALELDHFREWGLEARGLVLEAEERAVFDDARRLLVTEIAALPQGFVHRDYQSRNLLVTAGTSKEELGWIDFQDALLGPRAYDLVALLCDSYQPFERPFVEQRLDEYAAARGLDAEARRALGREFDLITLQRKLKDAGRFVFIERTRADASFLPFFEPTLEIVRQALGRLADVPELVALEGLLAKRLA